MCFQNWVRYLSIFEVVRFFQRQNSFDIVDNSSYRWPGPKCPIRQSGNNWLLDNEIVVTVSKLTTLA